MSVKCVSIWSCPTCYLNVGVLLGNWETYQKLIKGKYILKIKRANVYILFKCFAPLQSMLEDGQKISQSKYYAAKENNNTSTRYLE